MGLNYNPTIVPDGLVMYFDPANSRSSVGSGNTIYDLTGNSNTCTFSATPTYDVASKGNLLLAGYGTVAHTSTLWGSNQFTLSVWAKRTSGTSGIMISKDTNYIDHQYNGKTLASFYATAAYSPRQYLVSGISTSINNEWRQFTSTYDGTVGSLYENGALIGTVNTSILLNNTTDPLYIGQLNGGGYNFNGKLGTMMTYNRALSAQEVKQNYDATKGRYLTPENIVTNGLVLNYDMSNYRSAPFTGTSIYDLSGFGNTGTLTNGPTYSSLNDGAIVFDGSNDYINVANGFTNLFKNKDYWSIGLWVKLLSQTAGEPVLISAGPSIGYYDLFLEVANNAIYFAAGRGSNTGYIQNTNVSGTLGFNLTTNYFNIVFVKEGSTTGYVYVNSINIPMSVVGLGLSSMPNINEDMRIGTFKQSGFELHGNIAQVQMYNRALSAQEVLQNYNATKSRFGL